MRARCIYGAQAIETVSTQLGQGKIMEMTGVIFRRLDRFFETLAGEQLDLDGGSKFGLPPLGYDDTTLKGQIRGHLNREDQGFGDILERDVMRSEVDEKTTMDQAVSVIHEHTADNQGKKITTQQYRDRKKPRVQTLLREAIASIGNLPGGAASVEDSAPVSQYLQASQIAELVERLSEPLHPYLLTTVVESDFDGTVSESTEIILDLIAP